MVNNKEKLVAYLNKQLAVAEKAFEEIDVVDQAIEELKTKMIGLMAKRDLLGDKEEAAKDVAEIKGFIDSLCDVEDVAPIEDVAVEEVAECPVEGAAEESAVEETVGEIPVEAASEEHSHKTFLGLEL